MKPNLLTTCNLESGPAGFTGPILFHILTRPLAERMLGLDIDGEAAVTQLAETWLRAMDVKEDGDG